MHKMWSLLELSLDCGTYG